MSICLSVWDLRYLSLAQVELLVNKRVELSPLSGVSSCERRRSVSYIGLLSLV